MYFGGELEDPMEVSAAERRRTDFKSESTYGEIVYEQFASLLNKLNPQPGQVFWDLGCGAAKPLAVAALQYPELSACKGVEFM